MPEHSVQVTVASRFGLHARPAQRFAEIARVFQAETWVECRGRKVLAKTIMELLMLAAASGDVLVITARGEDARQAAECLRYVVEQQCFVEADFEELDPARHLTRLARFASCFESEIRVSLDGRTADARDEAALGALGMEPDSPVSFDISGPDAGPARAVLEMLARHFYYCEDLMASGGRHGY